MSVLRVVAILSLGYLVFLILETLKAQKNRAALSHIVHVNGTRGKSSVTRLIAAGLAEGGISTFCKTTGTVPMVINSQGIEIPIKRKGSANIKEQLWVLNEAVKDGADILVVECMALHPEYQYASGHQMLQADVGVITNVRLDHTEIMGETLEEIAEVLSLMIPNNGRLFTGDHRSFPQLEGNSKKRNTIAHLSSYTQEEAEKYKAINFPENIALALEVCQGLGVNREDAFRGMRQYKPDPYELSLYRLNSGGLFVGGLAINDSESIIQVFSQLKDQYNIEEKDLILLINNRSDRASRTEQMAGIVREMNPSELWILGTGKYLLTHIIKKKMGKHAPTITFYSKANDVNLSQLSSETVLFATGNIAGQGENFMKIIEQEGTQIV